MLELSNLAAKAKAARPFITGRWAALTRIAKSWLACARARQVEPLLEGFAIGTTR